MALPRTKRLLLFLLLGILAGGITNVVNPHWPFREKHESSRERDQRFEIAMNDSWERAGGRFINGALIGAALGAVLGLTNGRSSKHRNPSPA